MGKKKGGSAVEKEKGGKGQSPSEERETRAREKNRGKREQLTRGVDLGGTERKISVKVPLFSLIPTRKVIWVSPKNKKKNTQLGGGEKKESIKKKFKWTERKSVRE